jgi:16S rRNA (guanine966-N2)-methyltransferase
MRVIGGVAGGIPLFSPRSDGVRPTMDQVRAAIFSSLAARIAGARVLDLFAGSGGVGIEALSRGARTVTFVERDRAAADCIRRNLEKTKLLAGGSVVCLDAFAFLDRRTGPDGAFDLIFADPPYTSAAQPVDFARQLTGSAALQAALAPSGLFVLEKSPRHELTLNTMRWNIVRQKRYGSTEVVFLESLSGINFRAEDTSQGGGP